MEEINKNQENSSEKESITTRFDRERREWQEKIAGLTQRMYDMGQVSDVLVDVLSQRQVALEYTHTLMQLITSINAKLKKLKKERFIYYTQESDYRLDKEPRNMFIDVDLEKHVKTLETFSTHLSYMRGTVDSLDHMYYGIKWRIELEQYRRKQH